nr:agmatine deiminase [Hydra vulgaris]
MAVLAPKSTFLFPSESCEHEGTWLQWPHEFEYGVTYRESLDKTWVAITKAIYLNEKVHIIAYNITEQNRISNLLQSVGVSSKSIDFKIHKTNDVWIRDNGPIFVKDSNGNLLIEDWGFNGWGKKFAYAQCNKIPSLIAIDLKIDVLKVDMVLEGGAVELDGQGVLLTTKSSVLSQKPRSTRNPGMNQSEAELILSKYYGVSKIIWLNGSFIKEDVTDMHIDGIAKFVDGNKIVTMNKKDLLYLGLCNEDIHILYESSNIFNAVYTKVYLPLTQKNVVTTSGKSIGIKGCYVNYYVGNGFVLVPNYDDPHDIIANDIIQRLYPERKVIGIDSRNLYKNGGMIHCITQQQPATS